MAVRLSNIPLKTFKDYLRWKGLKCYRIKGGHEVWGCSGLTRPIVFQSHIDPVPEFILMQTIRNLNADKADFIAFLSQ